ncbi:MAG: DivIVA domain-containing protein [Nitrospirae bacterium]|nr:DivIVA domain-containing protein [Candidatus Troglogloeales bacterium]MBI3598973.1 DivIVA domain-containing protein [Candidatus Troglogloeales bacterium]
MKITPVDVRQVIFRISFKGYDPREVHSFLISVAEELETMVKDNALMKVKTEDQERVISELKRKESAVTDTLVAAQKAMEELRLSSQKEGELVIREAESRSEEITRSAVRQVTQLQGELVNLRRQRDLFIDKAKALVQSFDKVLEWGGEKDV